MCLCACVFTPGALKSQFFRSGERLDICFVCLFYLTGHQCHWQNKLGSMQSVQSVNNHWVREIRGKRQDINMVEKRWRRKICKCERDRFAEWIKEWQCEQWGKELRETERHRLGLSATPVICWLSRNRVGRMPLSSQHPDDDSPCSEPQNDYKLKLLEWEFRQMRACTHKALRRPGSNSPTRKKTKTSHTHRLTDSPGSVLWSYYVCASTPLLSGMMAEWECVKGS